MLIPCKTKALGQDLAWLFVAGLSKTRFLTWEGLTFISTLGITTLSLRNKPEMQAGHSAPLSSKCQRNPNAAWFLCTPHRSWNENVGGGAQSWFASQPLFRTDFPGPFDVEGFEGVLGEQVVTQAHKHVLPCRIPPQKSIKYTSLITSSLKAKK